MHYNNLITVKDIPRASVYGDGQQPAEDLIDDVIMRQLEDAYARYDKEQSNFWVEMEIEHLNSIRNRFSRDVCDKIPEIMESTWENTTDSRYIKFFSVEDNYKEDYENTKTDCVRLADGRIRPILPYEFVIKDGLVYQKNAGQLHHEKRTKKAKRMKALPNYPIKEAFKTYAHYLEYLGYTYDEESKSYGYYCNPNGYWDWFQIGGRWPTAFLVPDNCDEFGIGHVETRYDKMPETPEGYKWAVMARKKDIAWDVLYRVHLCWAMKRFHKLVDAFRQQKLPEGVYGNITENGISGFDDMLYVKGESMYENLRRRGISDGTKYHAGFYGFLNEDKWTDRGWDEEQGKEYPQKLDSFIDSLDNDTVLVAVDCHN